MKKTGIALVAICAVFMLGLLTKSAVAQTASDTPFGFAQLFANPSIGYGTHPAKAIFTSQTNIMGKPSYSFTTAGLSPTAGQAICQLEAGPSLRTRVRRLCVAPGIAAAAVNTLISIQNTTAAGAGTATVPVTMDGQDALFSGVARNTAAAAATTTKTYLSWPGLVGTATTASPLTCYNFDDGLFKPITLTPGVAQGIQVVSSVAAASGFATCSMIFTEEAY